MRRTELMIPENIANFVFVTDPENSQYIVRNYEFMRLVESRQRFLDRGDSTTAGYIQNDIEEFVRKYDSRYLTPGNAKVGDGATVVLYSDRYAGTIIKVTPLSITVQRDTATLDPEFKPEWIIGGFAGHCTNQEDQKYTYERDEHGEIYTFRWSDKHQSYGRPGNLRAIKGRHEFYDYNF